MMNGRKYNWRRVMAGLLVALYVFAALVFIGYGVGLAALGAWGLCLLFVGLALLGAVFAFYIVRMFDEWEPEEDNDKE